MDETSIKLEKLKDKFADGWLKSIEIDEGWYRIVLDCDAELSQLDPDYKILQIKEKFGGLRYYFIPSESGRGETRLRMEEIVKKYEIRASVTCEATGKPGIRMKSSGGWYKTLNPDYVASADHMTAYRVV